MKKLPGTKKSKPKPCAMNIIFSQYSSVPEPEIQYVNKKSCQEKQELLKATTINFTFLTNWNNVIDSILSVKVCKDQENKNQVVSQLKRCFRGNTILSLRAFLKAVINVLSKYFCLKKTKPVTVVIANERKSKKKTRLIKRVYRHSFNWKKKNFWY